MIEEVVRLARLSDEVPLVVISPNLFPHRGTSIAGLSLAIVYIEEKG
jgi:hypothetical protein